MPTVDVFIVAGFQLPANPLDEAAGNAGAVLFKHKGPICVNVGVAAGLPVMVRVAVVAHCAAVGVKV